MMVMEYLSVSFVEKDSFRNLILAYNKIAKVVTSNDKYEEMVAIKWRQQDYMRAPGDKKIQILVESSYENEIKVIE
jgi:hypothetical protein